MKLFAAVIFYLTLGFIMEAALAETTAERISRCDGKNDEMGKCARDAFKQADLDMNVAYRNLRLQYPKYLTNLNEQKGQPAIDLLKKSQLAWLKYRDRECDVVTAPKSGSPLFAFYSNACLADLTEKRTIDLTVNIPCEMDNSFCKN